MDYPAAGSRGGARDSAYPLHTLQGPDRRLTADRTPRADLHGLTPTQPTRESPTCRHPAASTYTFDSESISPAVYLPVTYSFLSPDPVEVQVRQVLDRLAAGDPPSAIERRQVDVKEEVGRRDRAGIIGPPRPQSEATARYLAEEMSCMANSDGGEAIIVGVADDGTRIGTAIESEWLRHRIYELTSGTLTVDVREASLDGTRLLVLVTHEAIEPIRVGGNVRWRVDDHCVEVDPTSWHTAKPARRGADWSAGPSGHTVADADPVALGTARRYLEAGGDTRAAELAQASHKDLLRRLNVVTGDGKLTNAGSLLFVATPTDGIDYIRRDAPGTDSTNRIRTSRPLIEQINQVEQAALAADRVVHLSEGFAHGQVRAIPERALRESIVNGVVHRDWLSPLPTTVEHIGDTLTVTSPGGFIGGIDPSNIITHPAVPRYRSLAETVATLRLAEREGIGVNRMVADMLALGRPGPEISEMARPVRPRRSPRRRTRPVDSEGLGHAHPRPGRRRRRPAVDAQPPGGRRLD
jgi:ATP-dependent DNA helicase RecG